MKPVLTLAMLAFFPLALAAQTASDVPPTALFEAPTEAGFAPIAASTVDLNEFLWKKRPLVVFANSPEDPAFGEQMRMLAARWPELAARDVVVITDTDPAAATAVRTKLRPRGFSLVLIEKDGSTGFRKPLPWDGREITRAIDKMPLRREEIRNAPAGGLLLPGGADG